MRPVALSRNRRHRSPRGCSPSALCGQRHHGDYGPNQAVADYLSRTYGVPPNLPLNRAGRRQLGLRGPVA